MYAISAAQRRARLGTRHRLAYQNRTDTVRDIADSLIALHATDPATVFLSVAARSRGGIGPQAVERALYADRELLRMLAMRRTMFVSPIESVPILQAACANAVAQKQHRAYSQRMERAGIGDGDIDTWLAEVMAQTQQALHARGAATGAQLSKDVPLLRTQVELAPEKAYSRPTSITTWVLGILGAQGRIVRGRPNGSWASSQYTWSPTSSWLGSDIPTLSEQAARVELIRRWLWAFGPALVSDIAWWTGWPLRQVRATLAQLDITEVDLDEGPGVLHTEDLAPVAEPEPWVALLPALDATAMGWQSRDWYVGAHRAQLFDRNGNIGPTVWCDGRIIGGWAQRPDGEIVWRLLEDIGTETTTRIGREVERLRVWYGDLRPAPRFRTPLERELTTA